MVTVEDIEPYKDSFFFSSTITNGKLQWQPQFSAYFTSKYGKPCPIHVFDCANNVELLQAIKDKYLETPVATHDMDIIVIPKEYSEGIDTLGKTVFFNDYKYIVSKLKKITSGVIDSSTYINNLQANIANLEFKHVLVPGLYMV